MTVLFLKPNPDKQVEGNPLMVLDPERKTYLPAEGAAVPANPYWIRRVADGDCVEYDPKSIVASADVPADEDNMIDEGDDDDIALQLAVDNAINAVMERLGAADLDIEQEDGKEAVLVLLDDAGAVIAKGTLDELNAFADENDAAKAAADAKGKKNSPSKKKGK